MDKVSVAAENQTTPGHRELLVDLNGFSGIDTASLKRISQAVDNKFRIAVQSTAALGELLWTATTNEDCPPEKSTILAAAELVQFLGEYMESIIEIRDDANFIVAEREAGRTSCPV